MFLASAMVFGAHSIEKNSEKSANLISKTLIMPFVLRRKHLLIFKTLGFLPRHR